MSEILAKQPGLVARLSRQNNVRFDSVSWPSDGHECPSYSNRHVPDTLWREFSPRSDDRQEVTLNAPLPRDLAQRFPNLTHLSLWQIADLKSVPATFCDF